MAQLQQPDFFVGRQVGPGQHGRDVLTRHGNENLLLRQGFQLRSGHGSAVLQQHPLQQVVELLVVGVLGADGGQNLPDSRLVLPGGGQDVLGDIVHGRRRSGCGHGAVDRPLRLRTVGAPLEVVLGLLPVVGLEAGLFRQGLHMVPLGPAVFIAGEDPEEGALAVEVVHVAEDPVGQLGPAVFHKHVEQIVVEAAGVDGAAVEKLLHKVPVDRVPQGVEGQVQHAEGVAGPLEGFVEGLLLGGDAVVQLLKRGVVALQAAKDALHLALGAGAGGDDRVEIHRQPGDAGAHIAGVDLLALGQVFNRPVEAAGGQVQKGLPDHVLDREQAVVLLFPAHLVAAVLADPDLLGLVVFQGAGAAVTAQALIAGSHDSLSPLGRLVTWRPSGYGCGAGRAAPPACRPPGRRRSAPSRSSAAARPSSP